MADKTADEPTPPTAGNGSGMTLVEIVVAVFVIALLNVLLVLLTMPRSRVGESARRSACLSNLRQIGLAFKQYAVDNNDRFPANGNPHTSPGSGSVFATLTNGNYLPINKVYQCPSEYPFDKPRRVVIRPGRFTNSYSCVVGNASGSIGLTETNSSDNPLIFDYGIAGAPGGVAVLNGRLWLASSPHGASGGNVLYLGGRAAFKKNFDCGADGTNGYVLEP